MATPLEVSVRYVPSGGDAVGSDAVAGGGAVGDEAAGGGVTADAVAGGGIPVVVVVGEIDMSNAGRFSEALKEAAGAAEVAEAAGGSGSGVTGVAGAVESSGDDAAGGGVGSGGVAARGGASSGGGAAGTFVVDLSRVEYLDSAGINALFEHLSRVRLIAPPLLVPVLTLAGLGDITTVRESSK